MNNILYSIHSAYAEFRDRNVDHGYTCLDCGEKLSVKRQKESLFCESCFNEKMGCDQ